MPPENMHPVRVVSQAESRVGLLTLCRRRLTARGVQPVGAVPHLFAWLSVYGAVAPTPGERCFLERPYRNAEGFQLCINACAQAVADSLNILLLDHSGAHTAQRLTIPANVRLLCWPPSCPELNPIEQVWRDLQDDLAWQPFSHVTLQQDSGGRLLQADDAPTRHSRSGDVYFVNAMNALSL